MSPLLIQWDRIRRRWVLILVIGLVAAAGALGASLLQGTTYTGRAALTIVSVDRAPEQDTVLAQGYADYFNQPSSQEVLRQSAGVSSSVTLNARIAAQSPIVYVEATTDSPEVAQDAATKMAVALRDDVNNGLRGNSQAQIADLQRQLDTARAQNNSDDVGRLQDAISALQSGTNQLQDLQLTAGVASNSSNAARNAGAAALGGLLLGALLAIALGRFENRIVTPNEVRDRLGLSVLAVVGGRRRSGEDGRAQLLRSLTGLTNPYGMPSPGVIALTGPYTSRASKSRVAIALAGLRALQGQTTLLLQTDLEADPLPSELSSMSGVADFLAERGGSRVDGKVFTNGRALLVSPPGSKRDDLFALFSRSHVQRLVTQGTALADLVVIDAPPVESVEGQVVCAVADRALLVLEEGETRAKDASTALDALGRTGSTTLGVVLVRNPNQMVDPGFLAERNWSPVRLPVAPPAGRPAPPAAPNRGGVPGPGSRPGHQVPPADRTAPISAKQLEEAREAANRGSAGLEVVAGAAVASPGTNGAPRAGVDSRDRAGVNGANREAAGAQRRDEKQGDELGDGAPGQRTPETEQPAGGSGRTTGAAGDGRQPGTRSGTNGKGASSGGGPGGSQQLGGPTPVAEATPGPSARVARRPSSEGKPSPRPKPGGEPASGGAPDAQGPKGAPGGVAKPAPTAKPAPDGSTAPPPSGRPAGGATPATPPTKPKTATPDAAGARASGKPATTPGSPEGARRIGTARFTTRQASTAGGTRRSAASDEGAGQGSDNLSAPTVTLRTEK